MKTNRKHKGHLIQFPGSTCQPKRIETPKRRAEGERTDLNDLLLPRRDEDGWLLDVTGDDSDMYEIRDGDKVLVDRSLMAGLRDIVIVEDEDGLTITTYKEIDGRPLF